MKFVERSSNKADGSNSRGYDSVGKEMFVTKEFEQTVFVCVRLI